MIYEPAGPTCSGKAQPGTRLLQASLLAWLQARDVFVVDSGIYNCRTVAGTSTPSLHGEGRAGDVGVRGPGGKWPTAPLRIAAVDELVDLMVTQHDALGIQSLIHDRRIWTVGKGWRTYGGVSPHYDHIHWEHTWAAARGLTQSTIDRALGATMADDLTPADFVDLMYDLMLARAPDTAGEAYWQGEAAKAPLKGAYWLVKSMWGDDTNPGEAVQRLQRQWAAANPGGGTDAETARYAQAGRDFENWANSILT